MLILESTWYYATFLFLSRKKLRSATDPAEGISAGLVSAMINVAGLLLLFCLDRLPSNWLSAIVTLVTILCTGMLAKVSPCPN